MPKPACCLLWITVIPHIPHRPWIPRFSRYHICTSLVSCAHSSCNTCCSHCIPAGGLSCSQVLRPRRTSMLLVCCQALVWSGGVSAGCRARSASMLCSTPSMHLCSTTGTSCMHVVQRSQRVQATKWGQVLAKGCCSRQHGVVEQCLVQQVVVGGHRRPRCTGQGVEWWHEAWVHKWLHVSAGLQVCEVGERHHGSCCGLLVSSSQCHGLALVALIRVLCC
mmetsp:Transcript_40227/g.89288  ORF Transcript_40227/g.89288 Transcript_40227/m.89288 type:complete len:221 (-) Transcript_40227:609-1271(-)